MSKTIAQYRFEKSLGKGTFGKVKLATHLPSGESVAVKILEKAKIKDVGDIERISREIHILKLIRHPNIIQLYDIIETPKYLYLVLEYANGGELFDHIVKHTRLRENVAVRYFLQIISGIEYLHTLNIVHRDLKPENLLLDDGDVLKIADFGLGNIYKDNE